MSPSQRLEKQWSSCFDHCHAGYRLQFHQLDRERNGLIFWDEQSGFNYDGRTHHRDGGFYS